MIHNSKRDSENTDPLADARSSALSIRAGILLAVAYVITGKLGLMLALPPGYASAIFPPAGIAVAAALIAGRHALAWIFLGSTLLNVWAAYATAQSVSAISLGVAIFIGAASTLQSATGGWILRRAIGYPAPFDKAHDVLRFLLLAPAICLVSASISVGGLSLAGIMDQTSSTTNWATWWIGDTLGVILVFPLVLVAAGEPRELWRKREISVAVPIIAALTLFVFVFVKANRWEQEESLAEFRAHSRQMANHLQTRLDEQEFLLVEIESFLTHDLRSKVSRQEFQRFAKKSLARFTTLQAIEWAPLVAADARRTFEVTQGEGLPGFQICDIDDTGQLRRAAEKASYFPVTYVEPLERNRAAVGFDLASTPDRMLALSSTRSLSIPVATKPIRLVQDRLHQAGILLMLSVSEGPNSPGVVLTVLRVADFIDRALQLNDPMAHIRMVDVEAQETVFENFPSNENGILSEHVVQYGTRQYQLKFAPTEIYLAQHRGWQSWTVLAVGLFGTGLLGALLLLGTGHTARVESLVEERTKELEESEERWKFALEGAGDGVWDWNLKTGEMYLSKQEMAVLGFDGEEARITNIEEWVDRQHPSDQVRRRQAMERYFAGDASLYACEFRTRCRDGRWKWILARGMIVSSAADGTPLRMIGTHSDIDDRKRIEEQLKMAAAVFETVDEGIVVTNESNVIISVNPAYEQVTGFSADEAIGRNPNLLSSGHHNKQFYSELWNSLRESGHWRGELWNRRKDGQLFIAAMSIAAMLDEDGNRSGHIGIFADVTQKKLEEERVSYLAHHDLLTDLPNRVLYKDRLRQALIKARRDGELVGLMFIDLDNFKPVNDEFGHAIGDSLLAEAAKRMLSCVRESDTVARVGGDEFVVLLPKIEAVEDALGVAEKIRQSLQTPFTLGGHELSISSSIGVAVYPNDGTDEESLVANADNAMYRAKRKGRNAVEMHV